MQNSDFWIRNTSLHGSQLSFVPFVCKSATLGAELQISMGPRHHLCFFCIQISDFSARIASLYGCQPSSVFLCIHNSDISTRITSLPGSQTSPVVMCMQNNVISIRNTRVDGSQASFVVFECKTSLLGPELKVSMGPTPHLWVLHSKQRL